MEKKVWLENSLSQFKKGDRVGVSPVTEQVVRSNDPHEGQGLVWLRDMSRVGVKHRIAKVRLLCYRWLSSFLNLLAPEFCI
jgi:hypothetical protein